MLSKVINNLKFYVYSRYTLFIVLYPIGVSGELLAIYAAFPYVKENNLFTLHMPNMLNFAFDCRVVLVGAMLMYIPGNLLYLIRTNTLLWKPNYV